MLEGLDAAAAAVCVYSWELANKAWNLQVNFPLIAWETGELINGLIVFLSHYPKGVGYFQYS